MDLSDVRQAVEGWIAEFRALARRISSASASDREATLLPLRVSSLLGCLGACGLANPRCGARHRCFRSWLLC